jgi:SH3-like domain-containing protein
LRQTGESAVLRHTAVYRIPDAAAEALDVAFSEGQPATVHAQHDGWDYVRLPQGASGWVPRTAVVRY